MPNPESYYPSDTTDFKLPIKDVGNTRVVASTSNQRVPVAVIPVFTRSCLVKMTKTNTGTAYLGGENVTASNGLPLEAGESVPVGVNNLADLYIFFEDAGDEARIAYGK